MAPPPPARTRTGPCTAGDRRSRNLGKEHHHEFLRSDATSGVDQHTRPGGVVPVITTLAMIAAGLVFLTVVAIVVGIIDATRAPRWRRIAAERREQWESRRPEFHGVDGADPDDD